MTQVAIVDWEVISRLLPAYVLCSVLSVGRAERSVRGGISHEM